MTIFTIENETNNITAHATIEEAHLVQNAHAFKTERALTKLAESWPTSRLAEIWNGIPGAVAVKKFTDRAKAVSRIWIGIQSLAESPSSEAATDTESLTDEAPELGTAPMPGSKPTRRKAASKVESQQEQTTPAHEEVHSEAAAENVEANVGEQTPDVAPEEAKATKKATRQKKTPTGEMTAKAPREESKTSQVIAMLKREGGTTLEEIMSTMGWLKHTTRAMLSAGGSLTKKHGLVVTSEKVGEKRVYSIKA